MGFNTYTFEDSKINFNIYFFSFDYFDFPQVLNFTATITYNAILRILDDKNSVNCQKEEIGKDNEIKYQCLIETRNSGIKNIQLNNDINLENKNKNLNLIISPLASEYMNNLQNLPNTYNNLFDDANIFLLQKSVLVQNGRSFNISGKMNENPNFEKNKKIELIANPESQQEKKEINCSIIDNNLERYTINCKVDNNIKYNLNNSLSINDKNILLIVFGDESSIVNNTDNMNNYNYRIYSKKSSGLNTGGIIAIILVPVIALALIIFIIIFLKRKNSHKNNNISSNESSGNIKINK